jgi:hypothetical protein
MRKYTVPTGRAILLQILVKEDSFAEDSRLTTIARLNKQSGGATDKIVYQASIDNKHQEIYRSAVLDLKYLI